MSSDTKMSKGEVEMVIGAVEHGLDELRAGTGGTLGSEEVEHLLEVAKQQRDTIDELTAVAARLEVTSKHPRLTLPDAKCYATAAKWVREALNR